MSSIITSILSSTVGLLWNKARDSTADKLKDGDITDAKIREIVVGELTDIKTKLDGLSRKDLLSSYSFLQEGVDLLNVSLDKSSKEQRALMLNETQDASGETSGETSTEMPSVVDSGILNEALQLSRAMGKLKIHSEEFVSAKDRFKYARIKATEAFSNEALRIEDRIFAAKLRIISEILECLQNPETAATVCLSFMKQLHGLPAIREMFTVYLYGGVKALLNKKERAENVKSVMLINYVLFQFISKFSNEYSNYSLAWPAIELPDRNFYPIFNWEEVSTRKSMREALTQTPNGNELILDEEINPDHSAVNSHGEIVVGCGHDIKVISKTGESKVVKLPDIRESEVTDQVIVGLAVDKHNNVYILKGPETPRANGQVTSYPLHVLDESYNLKHDSTLDFLETMGVYGGSIAVNKNNDIIVIQWGHPHVYVCDNTGQLKHKFEQDSHSGLFIRLSTSKKNEIMLPSGDRKNVHVYTEEGDTKSLIKVSEGLEVWRVAFHHVISRIIVLTRFRGSYILLCHFETGELETSAFFGKGIDGEFVNITSHPSGPVAVVRKRSITYI